MINTNEDKLKQFRLLNGKSQEQLANEVGVKRVTYTKWETGENDPPTHILPAIAKALGCKIDDLFDKEE